MRDFALMNVASAIKLSGNNIAAIRMAVNAVAATVETGKLAVESAARLQVNAYKIPLMHNLVKRAISGSRRQHGRNAMGNQPWGQTVLVHAAWTLNFDYCDRERLLHRHAVSSQ